MWNRTLVGVVSAIGLAVLSSQAQAVTRVFGSKLDRQITPGQLCRQSPDLPVRICTWVLTQPQNNPNGARAPANGTITQLKLMACGRGTFVFQIARGNPATHQFSVVRTGPLINYVGNNNKNCGDGGPPFFIETFNVSVPVKQGDFLAVVANKVNFLYSAGNDGDMFDLPLADLKPARTATNSIASGFGSGQLMLQAVMTSP